MNLLGPIVTLCACASLFAVWTSASTHKSRIKVHETLERLEALERKYDSLRMSLARRIKALEDAGTEDAVQQWAVQQLEAMSEHAERLKTE